MHIDSTVPGDNKWWWFVHKRPSIWDLFSLSLKWAQSFLQQCLLLKVMSRTLLPAYLSCIIWSINPETWPSLPGLKTGVRERIQNKKTLCYVFDWWQNQTQWVQKQCQYESSELTEAQGAELMMNLDKPKKEMLIGLISVWYAMWSFYCWTATGAVLVCLFLWEI